MVEVEAVAALDLGVAGGDPLVDVDGAVAGVVEGERTVAGPAPLNW